MALYAIGDIQGCYRQFSKLLKKIQFSADKDRLILLGDLVNRGRNSLQVVRFAMQNSESVDVVLGNHDLHLLAALENVVTARSGCDTFFDILNAPEREDIKEWLYSRPLFIHDTECNTLAVHAGIHPFWTLPDSISYAEEIHTLLRGKKRRKLLTKLYGNKPRRWSESLKKWKRARFIVNVYTRMRYIDHLQRLDFKATGKLGTQDPELTAWFNYPNRKKIEPAIVFGHWSTLGVYQRAGLIGLDSGCCWGGYLTAARLDTDEIEISQVRCDNNRQYHNFL